MNAPIPKISRRRFFGGVSFAALGTVAYARWFESEWIRKSFINVPSAGQPGHPVRLLHLSDLHASTVVGLPYLQRAIEAAVAWKPDVICVTGDFVTRKFEDASGYSSVLRVLSSTAPTFASLGNHDGGYWAGDAGGYADVQCVTELLRASGIQLLHNDSAQIELHGRRLSLVGVGDIWAGHLDISRAFARRQPGQTIVLSHNPDTKELLGAFEWDLMLCGHTHGGQLRVPWVGATPFAPVRDKRYVAGLRRWDQRWIHVTRGVGSVFGLRINCPPEISCLTLT